MTETHRSEFPELGFYGLPGHTRSPRDVIAQVRDAEELGVGNVMISERQDYKEISAICGACAAVDGAGSSSVPRPPTSTPVIPSSPRRWGARSAACPRAGSRSGWRRE
ncbi:MAG: hypothetical protein U5R31_17625 [Acidimicrobiia bacterium]|nr:hypothetical protein [Acidimicrobiia bacterium]